MEGPYRDLGGGFARLTGVEGARRGPSRITSVEAALVELLRNARDAGARNVFVSSVLRRRRFRNLTVIDDGVGIPDAYTNLVFEPGVTTRHLDPTLDPGGTPHGTGLSLYHIRNLAVAADVKSAAAPTSLSATFDTRTLPERSLQSGTRPSRTNLAATISAFLERANASTKTPINAYYGPPARILARLLHNCIIQRDQGAEEVAHRAGDLGLEVSTRTVQRIKSGQVPAADRVRVGGRTAPMAKRRAEIEREGALLRVGEEESARIADILRGVAAASFLEIEDLKFEARPGELILRARVHEPEDAYE